MFKLIIVDDEEIVREGLRQFIDWNELGFELMACLENGEDAIDYVNHHIVDVVLTDIDMADMSGLDLSQYLNEKYPMIKTVIISGHRNFEYAQRAIKYNVEHYLTKPAEIDEIKVVFTKIRNELIEHEKDKVQKEAARRKYENLIPLLKEQFLLYISTGFLKDKDELERRLRAIDIPADPSSSCCCIVDIHINRAADQFVKSKMKFESALQNLFHRKDNNIYYLSSFHSNHQLKVLAVSPRTEKKLMERNVKQFIGGIKQSIQNNFNIDIIVEIGTIYNSLIELSEHAEITTRDRITEDVMDKETRIDIKEYREFMHKYKQFMPLIINGDTGIIIEKLNEIFVDIERLPIADVQRLIIDFLAMITHSFADLGVDIIKKEEGKFSYQDILKINEIGIIKQRCNGWLEDLIGIYSMKDQNSPTKQMIEKAKLYIQKRYNEDISLEDVSEHIYLNPVYFSRLFKEYTGQNFSNYLRDIRIEEAIKLLGDHKYKVYEISKMVGYRSSKYFSRVFKQVTGYTPQEYNHRKLRSVEIDHIR